ncbi:uncharacterized protein LOC130645737 [Hydractinia symbiolongicarpus]|uniref:uncharacterized protein LOC130645737 n=1 Tax=Hydractinia symbiolongicarpus TaxID=13093 RepID=UPI00254CEFC7|nr:uncharacterized protein LOC130645737 [Hydractinia symbiolongicarpus]
MPMKNVIVISSDSPESSDDDDDGQDNIKVLTENHFKFVDWNDLCKNFNHKKSVQTIQHTQRKNIPTTCSISMNIKSENKDCDSNAEPSDYLESKLTLKSGMKASVPLHLTPKNTEHTKPEIKASDTKILSSDLPLNAILKENKIEIKLDSGKVSKLKQRLSERQKVKTSKNDNIVRQTVQDPCSHCRIKQKKVSKDASSFINISKSTIRHSIFEITNWSFMGDDCNTDEEKVELFTGKLPCVFDIEKKDHNDECEYKDDKKIKSGHPSFLSYSKDALQNADIKNEDKFGATSTLNDSINVIESPIKLDPVLSLDENINCGPSSSYFKEDSQGTDDKQEDKLKGICTLNDDVNVIDSPIQFDPVSSLAIDTAPNFPNQIIVSSSDESDAMYTDVCDGQNSAARSKHINKGNQVVVMTPQLVNPYHITLNNVSFKYVRKRFYSNDKNALEAHQNKDFHLTYVKVLVQTADGHKMPPKESLDYMIRNILLQSESIEEILAVYNCLHILRVRGQITYKNYPLIADDVIKTLELLCRNKREQEPQIFASRYFLFKFLTELFSRDFRRYQNNKRLCLVTKFLCSPSNQYNFFKGLFSYLNDLILLWSNDVRFVANVGTETEIVVEYRDLIVLLQTMLDLYVKCCSSCFLESVCVLYSDLYSDLFDLTQKEIFLSTIPDVELKFNVLNSIVQQHFENTVQSDRTKLNLCRLVEQDFQRLPPRFTYTKMESSKERIFSSEEVYHFVNVMRNLTELYVTRRKIDLSLLKIEHEILNDMKNYVKKLTVRLEGICADKLSLSTRVHLVGLSNV